MKLYELLESTQEPLIIELIRDLISSGERQIYILAHGWNEKYDRPTVFPELRPVVALGKGAYHDGTHTVVDYDRGDGTFGVRVSDEEWEIDKTKDGRFVIKKIKDQLREAVAEDAHLLWHILKNMLEEGKKEVFAFVSIWGHYTQPYPDATCPVTKVDMDGTMARVWVYHEKSDEYTWFEINPDDDDLQLDEQADGSYLLTENGEAIKI